MRKLMIYANDKVVDLSEHLRSLIGTVVMPLLDILLRSQSCLSYRLV